MSTQNLPDGWLARWDSGWKEWFYVNTYTKQSQWQKPSKAAVDQKHSANGSDRVAPQGLPQGWVAQWDAKHEQWYYANTYTKQSQWEKPTEPARSFHGVKLTPGVANSQLRYELGTTNVERLSTTEPTRASPRPKSKPSAIPSASVHADGNARSKGSSITKPTPLFDDIGKRLDNLLSEITHYIDKAGISMLYQKLPEDSSFRVLKLKQGFSNDPLSGTLLQPIGLNLNVKYEALSYRWSEVDSQNPAVIEINDTELPIGPGLHAALLHFRDQVMPRWLWIDQICINQTDPAEKLAQIEIMGDIYRKAQAVLIWLGEANDQSDVAMEFFPILMEQVQRDHEASELQQSTKRPRDIIKQGGTLATTVATLFSRPWFGRVWTLQEAASGQRCEVWCGKKSFSYQLLDDFQRNCRNDEIGHWTHLLQLIESESGPQTPENSQRALMTHLHVVSLLKEDPPVSSVVMFNSLRSLDCLRDEDRIYSVLQFLNPGLVKKIVHRKNVTPAQLYHLVASHEVLDSPQEYLGAAGLSQQRASSQSTESSSGQPFLLLPSWVPDWTYRVRANSYWVQNRDCLHKTGKPLYAAGGLARHHCNHSASTNDNILYIGGTVIDKVGECATPYDLANDPEDRNNERAGTTFGQAMLISHQSYVVSCMKLAQKCSQTYGMANIKQACRHSLLGGMVPGERTITFTRVPTRASDEVVNSLFEEFEGLVSKSERLYQEFEWLKTRAQTSEPLTEQEKARLKDFGNELDNKWDDSMEFTKNLTKLLYTMAEACKGRRFFITSEGRRMGVAPDITKPGDKICIIPGACAPFVIRPKGIRYQLVGECYIAGIMDGEIMERENVFIETLVFE